MMNDLSCGYDQRNIFKITSHDLFVIIRHEWTWSLKFASWFQNKKVIFKQKKSLTKFVKSLKKITLTFYISHPIKVE
jgi:hypothetical protein